MGSFRRRVVYFLMEISPAAAYLRSEFSELVQTTRLVTIFDFANAKTDAVRGVRVINLYPVSSGIAPAPVDPNA
jgi:predicted transcriptional regulator with HTH domain